VAFLEGLPALPALAASRMVSNVAVVDEAAA